MIHVVIVGTHQKTFADVARVLEQYPVDITWLENGTSALDHIAENMENSCTTDLLITDDALEDMTGRTLVEQVITRSPVTNCVAKSDLSSDRFHETFEGLGVLMQLPLNPDTTDGEALVTCMKKIGLL
jgi:CheY-like chemotaxis protein